MSSQPERTFDTVALLILGGVLLAMFLSGCSPNAPDNDAARRRDSRAATLDSDMRGLSARQDAQDHWNEAAAEHAFELEHELFQMKVIVGSILLKMKERGPEWDNPANVAPEAPPEPPPVKRKSSQPRFAIG